MFLSGAVKLLSGDPTWRDLAALDFHFETQPLPTVFAWYAINCRSACCTSARSRRSSSNSMLPFLIFLPRNCRVFAAGWIHLLLQLLIVLTGNYNFFNLLTIVLCLALLDDRALRLRAMPA